MLEEKNIGKIITSFYVIIFVVVTILIVIFLLAYYLTPNNYILIKFIPDKFTLDKQKEYTIKPHSNITIEYDDLKNKLIGFDKETNLLVQNYYKSQGITCMSDDLIKIKYSSSILILNSTDNPVNLTIRFYNKK